MIKNSNSMHRVVHGSGPRAIVYLHGWSGDHHSADPLLPYLPEGTRLIAFDLPGVGRSPTPSSWDATVIAEQIFAELQQIEAEQLTILGNCSGANLLLPVIHRIDEVADELVFIDPFAFTPWYFRLLLSWPFGSFFYWMAFLTPVGRWLTNASLKKNRTEDSNLTAGFGRVHPWDTYRYLRILSSLGHGSTYPDNPLPTKILVGENTFAAVRESAGIWAETWASAEIRVLPGSGHLPIEEATDEVTRAIGFAETRGSSAQSPIRTTSQDDSAMPGRN